MNDLVTSLSLPIANPTWIFFVVMLVVLLAPLVFERLRVPQIVGMILAGVLIGPYGLGVLTRDASFELFGQVGLYYIMFTAGLSMDTRAMSRDTGRVLTFGLLSFGLPFVVGLGVAAWGMGFPMAAAVLVACILSSHTMVSFPVVTRYGLTRYPGVTFSVMATMISLIMALFVLAGLVGVMQGGATITFWLGLIAKCAVFVGLLFYAYPRIIRLFFRKFSDEILQYIFVLTMVFFSAAVSQALGLEGVLGAFLAGLIFNRYIPEAVPLMRHIDFVGNAIFIPYFLIGVGMLINLPAMFSDAESVVIVLSIVGLALFTKWFACMVGARLLNFDSDVRGMTIGLTSGHAAGALAMVMVGRSLYLADGSPLVDDVMLNAMVLLILVSCIFSAFVTTNVSKRIVMKGVSDDEKTGDEDKILVAIHNPASVDNLVNVSLMMRPHRSTVPLVGVKLVVDADDNEREIAASRELVKHAAQIAASAGINMKKVVRSGINLNTALTYVMKDFDASEIIMGYHREGERYMPQLAAGVDDLLTRVSRQVIFAGFTRAINTIRCIHVVVPRDAEREVGFQRWLMHVSRLARQIDCRINFYSTSKAWERIESFCAIHYKTIRLSHVPFFEFSELSSLESFVHSDHLLVVISARQGSFSYQSEFEQIPALLAHYFSDASVMLIFPDQYGVKSVNASFRTGFKEPTVANQI